MIRVQLARLNDNDYKALICHYPWGESTMTDENGWVYILDRDGLTIGAHPRDKVDAISIEHDDKAGENKVSGDNSKDGN